MIEWLNSSEGALSGMAGLATVVMALVAIAALISAGLDSAARTRPYVVVEYEIWAPYDRPYLRLVVRNAGQTAARKLKVTFDPPFQESEEPGKLGTYVARRYKDAIDVLGPGQKLTSLFVADPKDDEPPEHVEAKVSYESPFWRCRDYHDTFILQRSIYTQQLSVGKSGKDGRRGR